MTTIAQATDLVVAKLTAAGLRATTDERDVNPPCVIVPAPAVQFRFSARCWDATWPLLLVVPDAGRPANLVALGELIDSVQAALGGECHAARPVAVAGVEGAPPLPGYELTYPQSIE